MQRQSPIVSDAASAETSDCDQPAIPLETCGKRVLPPLGGKAIFRINFCKKNH
ncbi:hypothetical protein [Sphingobium yanoikuyae]|uniref:hypothetical protein n=1 Tax=Sphingobium yanoikuyae TaxID=13690 RepID=UPI0022DDDC52|nr:hypothetical protein [Sphingobium yanoikuyae]WBQ19400.1 hypothetical protein PAE53_23775 [Sphingobium yanoikuyae]